MQSDIRDGPRPITIVHTSGMQDSKLEQQSYVDICSRLNGLSYLFAGLLFICQIVMACCYCRPLVVLAGLWLAILYLFHAMLGSKAVKTYAHTLLLGHALLSVLVALLSLLAVGLIFSGNVVTVCASSLHEGDNASVITLYIVEVVSLVASVPTLLGTVTCLLTAAISFKAIQNPKQPSSFLVCLNNSDASSASKVSNMANSHSHPVRCYTPPPAYRLPHEESFA